MSHVTGAAEEQQVGDPPFKPTVMVASASRAPSARSEGSGRTGLAPRSPWIHMRAIYCSYLVYGSLDPGARSSIQSLPTCLRSACRFR